MILWYETYNGAKLWPLQGVQSVEYALVYGDVSMLVVETAAPIERVKDRRITVYRQGVREITALLNRFDTKTSDLGQSDYSTYGSGPNSFLQNRIVNDYSGSAGAKKTGLAGDMMGDIVTEQMLDAVDSQRYIPNMTVWPSTFGPSVSDSFAWQKVLSTLQGLQTTSRANNNEVFFAVVPNTNSTYQFRTYTGQPGNDRTRFNAIVFSQDWGNLSEPKLSFDYSNESNAIYAGGQGTESARIVEEVNDFDAQISGAVSRRERFYSVPMGSTVAEVQAAGQSALSKYRPQLSFSGTILSTPQTPYGGLLGWKLGDRVPVRHDGYSFEAIVRAVSVKVDNTGKETIKARVEATL